MFLNNFYENFKENKNSFKTKIENDLFDVCITNNQIKEIENKYAFPKKNTK